MTLDYQDSPDGLETNFTTTQGALLVACGGKNATKPNQPVDHVLICV